MAVENFGGHKYKNFLHVTILELVKNRKSLFILTDGWMFVDGGWVKCGFLKTENISFSEMSLTLFNIFSYLLQVIIDDFDDIF